MKNYLILIIFAVLLVSCNKKTTSAVTEGAEIAYTDVATLAKNNFKGDYKILNNKNNAYVAIYEVLPETNIYGKSTTKILVYDVKSKSVIWGKNAENGVVSWEGKYELKVDYTQDTKKLSLVYNPKTKQVTYNQ
ncbi:MAG: hypothetical protein R2771_04575 [Saprospiraceae bacterium]